MRIDEILFSHIKTIAYHYKGLMQLANNSQLLVVYKHLQPVNLKIIDKQGFVFRPSMDNLRHLGNP